MGKQIDFGLNAAKNTDCVKKKLEVKVVKNSIPTKNSVGAHAYLPQCEAGWLERLQCLKYYNVPTETGK